MLGFSRTYVNDDESDPGGHSANRKQEDGYPLPHPLKALHTDWAAALLVTLQIPATG